MTGQKSIDQLDVWQDVPKPEKLIEAVKLAASTNLLDRQQGLSGLRGAIKILRAIPERERVTRFLMYVLKKYSQ